MSRSKSFGRGSRICCVASAILLLVVIIALIIVYFTVLKPKKPEIVAQPATLKHFMISLPPAALVLNVTLGIVVTVNNRNYGGFEYEASKAYVNYHGEVVGEAPIPPDTIAARSQHNITTNVTIFGERLLDNPVFLAEVARGAVGFESNSTLHGKVIVWKVFKAKGTSSCVCDITIQIFAQTAQSVCRSDIKL